MTVDGRNIPTLGRFTRFAGKGGLGMEYNLPSGLGLFVQGVSYVYKFDRGGFDKTQADLLWNAGLSYRVHRPWEPRFQGTCAHCQTIQPGPP